MLKFSQNQTFYIPFDWKWWKNSEKYHIFEFWSFPWKINWNRFLRGERFFKFFLNWRQKIVHASQKSCPRKYIITTVECHHNKFDSSSSWFYIFVSIYFAYFALLLCLRIYCYQSMGPMGTFEQKIRNRDDLLSNFLRWHSKVVIMYFLGQHICEAWTIFWRQFKRSFKKTLTSQKSISTYFSWKASKFKNMVLFGILSSFPIELYIKSLILT